MTVHNVSDLAERINIGGTAETGRSMAELTTFKTGGMADIFITPAGWDDIVRARKWAVEQGLPFLLLGGGANLLASDSGVPGVVVTTSPLAKIEVDGELVSADAGAEISVVAETAASRDLKGLEFIYRMPGSTGGAVWMNARCYGVSVNERLAWVDFIDAGGTAGRYYPDPGDFAYKRSPFQSGERIITRAGFRLQPGDRNEIVHLMDEHRRDRVEKGHFRYPCAGSVFKNNRDFGAPTGKLIDSLGLKGTRIGNAMIAPFHGNIIINTGNASSSDILALIELAEDKVYEAYGFQLEREVLLAGDWS